MTITKQDPQKTSGSGTGQSKSLKKRKVVKTCPEKCPEMKKPTEVPVTKEVEEVKENVEQAEAADVSDQQTPTPESVNVNGSVKSPQLEKRKQEGSEWKTLKKIDYQRLETVLEEVQSSGEAASSKINMESGKSSANSEQVPRDVGSYGRLKRPWFYNLVSITEHPELLSGDETQSEEDEEKQQIIKNQQHVERLDGTEGHGEPAEKIPKEVSGKFNADKRSVILNGMVEILPIFSNDKFVCSRDAISIEECEELDNLEKTLPSSGKFIIDSKTSKDSRTVDIKPFHSSNSVKKGFRDRLTEKLQNFREAVGGKLHRPQQSMFTEDIARHSSHFINFLLFLTPFAEERQKLLQEKKLAESDVIECKGSKPEERQPVGIEGRCWSAAKILRTASPNGRSLNPLPENKEMDSGARCSPIYYIYKGLAQRKGRESLSRSCYSPRPLRFDSYNRLCDVNCLEHRLEILQTTGLIRYFPKFYPFYTFPPDISPDCIRKVY